MKLLPTESHETYKFSKIPSNGEYMGTITNNPKSQPASLFMQFYLLFMRNFKSTIRNTVSLIEKQLICKFFADDKKNLNFNRK